MSYLNVAEVETAAIVEPIVVDEVPNIPVAPAVVETPAVAPAPKRAMTSRSMTFAPGARDEGNRRARRAAQKRARKAARRGGR